MSEEWHGFDTSSQYNASYVKDLREKIQSLESRLRALEDATAKDVNFISDREKFLMKEAMSMSQRGYYKNLDEWLSDVIDHCGHTVEMLLSHDADGLPPPP